MKAIKYLLSFFYDPGKELSEKHSTELNEFKSKLLEVKSASDPYEAALILIGSSQNKSELINNIIDSFEKVNYGQHDEVVKNLNVISSKLEILEKTSWIAISSVNGTVKSIPYEFNRTYIRLENKMSPMSLEALKRQDEQISKGYISFEPNHPQVQKYVDEIMVSLLPVLSTILN